MNEIQNFPMEVKALDDSGVFEGLAAVYDNVDLQGETISPGAFTKTIRERPQVKLLYQHDTNQPIGLCEVSDSAVGLIVRGRLSLGVARARETYELLKTGVLDSFSIGYDVIKDRRLKDGTRVLTELRLWEVSIVTFPANPKAVVGRVKRDAWADDYAEMKRTVREIRDCAQHMADEALVARMKRTARDIRAFAAQIRRG